VSILSNLEPIEEPVVNEELSIILEEVHSLPLDIWESDFIMDIAEKNWLSNKQSDKITQIYKKYIDGENNEYSG